MDVDDPAYAGTYPWAAEKADLLARIHELEAQAAVLAEALTASERWMGTFLAAFSVGKLEPRHPVLQARSLLANLPQAVQAHLERERALEELAEWVADNVDVESIVFEAEVKPLLAAYRAVGGEG